MTTEELIINGVTVPLEKGIGTILTYSIKDIEQPDKRKATFSKTIKLPGSKVLDTLFNYIFEINSDSTFNPNLKAESVYLINSVVVFKGIIQLKKITKLDNSKYMYDVVLLGSLANIFIDFGGGYIDDLDMNWGDFNHNYDAESIIKTWDTSYLFNGAVEPFQYGSGYMYPMMNRGWDADKPTWTIYDYFPAAYAKEYIDRMFLAAGFEYDSIFFNSNYFKKLIIPYNGTEFGMADTPPVTAEYTAPIFATSGTSSNNTPAAFDTLEFQTVVTDTTGAYNTTTGEFTVPITDSFNYLSTVNLQYTVTLNSGAPNIANMISTFQLECRVMVNGVMVDESKAWVRKDGTMPVGDYTTAPYAYVIGGNPEYLNQIVPSLSLLPSYVYTKITTPYNQIRISFLYPLFEQDVVTVILRGNYISDIGETLNFEDTVTGVKYEGAATINLLPESDLDHHKAGYYNTMNSRPVGFKDAVPKKIKKTDFFKAIIEMFNLYVETDKNNPKKLKIEPRSEFYTPTTQDYSSKLDVSKDLEYEMLASGNKSNYSYTYKEDSDYYNKLYKDTWGLVYGNRQVEITNDFNGSTYAQTSLFSATPLVGSAAQDRILSTIIGVDSNMQPIKITANIRILQYGGMLPTNSQYEIQEWNPSTTGITYTSLVTYPFCGHFNHPFLSTEDINFGLPKEIYYDDSFNTITINNNNLYNKYHKTELEEQSNKDSRLVTGKFLLNPTDVANLDFSNQYFFDNAYFRLQELKYNPSEYSISECKFLKLKTGATFIPSDIVLYGGWDKSIGNESVPAIHSTVYSDGNNLSTKSANVKGINNYISPTAKLIDIVGNNNRISTASKSIYILGENNIIGSNLENVSLINTSNVTVTESNVTYINGEIKGTGSVETITTNTTADEMISTYLCDTSAGSISISLPDFPTVGKIWNFKKIAINNTIQIRVNAPNSIDGLLVKNITALNNSYSLQFDGATYKII